MHDTIYRAKNFRAKRVSTYDRSGGNIDSIRIAPGETKVIANISGPGIISHIWMTSFGKWGPDDDRNFDSLTLRKMLLKIYWDDEEIPSIMCPVGDFFVIHFAEQA